MAQQPPPNGPTLFGGPPLLAAGTSQQAAQHGAPASTSESDTYIMSNSPSKPRRNATDGYRPKVTRTLGERPACLVNASVTYCGDDQIYAFGGFDQYTDEVYNHVLKLDLVSHQWSLVDNYGDIPGVRMGHTATLYQGDKLLVFGGENEHRSYLSDLIVFDLKSAHWTQPAVTGHIPTGRARHAALLHEDKLFIIGGITGHDNYVLEDICYLDLKTYTWSKAWRFVGRFDHSAYIWGDRIWVFGGLSADMDKVSDLWWLDLKGSPVFDTPPPIGTYDRSSGHSRPHNLARPTSSSGNQPPAVGSSGYAANSRTAQVNPPSFQLRTYAPVAPGSISAIKFVSGPNIPSQSAGSHFHVYSSGTLLDFITPAGTISHKDCSISALDLTSLRWQKLAEGRDVFRHGYQWHYCCMNDEGTKAWLLGCPTEGGGLDLGTNGVEEYLSDIMEIDLGRYGFLGNTLSAQPQTASKSEPLRTKTAEASSLGLGGDLARMFNRSPESGSGTDFVVTTLSGDYSNQDLTGSALIRQGDGLEGAQFWQDSRDQPLADIYVHRLILQARWPHFARLWNAQMVEFNTKKMHIPEPHSVVRSFFYYLYTDRIDPMADADTDSDGCSSELADIAGLLVLANMYNIPHLRLLCVNRLSKELDVDHACVIWYCAGLAGEEWLQQRAAGFCLKHWGRVVRTSGFLHLPRMSIVELSQEIDAEGRVIGGEEVDLYNMADSRYHDVHQRKESMSSSITQTAEAEADEDEGMDMN